MAPLGAMRPTRLPLASVNQRLPVRALSRPDQESAPMTAGNGACYALSRKATCRALAPPDAKTGACKKGGHPMPTRMTLAEARARLRAGAAQDEPSALEDRRWLALGGLVWHGRVQEWRADQLLQGHTHGPGGRVSLHLRVQSFVLLLLLGLGGAWLPLPSTAAPTSRPALTPPARVAPSPVVLPTVPLSITAPTAASSSTGSLGTRPSSLAGARGAHHD